MNRPTLVSEEERCTTLRGCLAGGAVMLPVPLMALLDESGLGGLFAFIWCLPWSFAVTFFSTLFFALRYWDNVDEYFGGWNLIGRLLLCAGKAVLLEAIVLGALFLGLGLLSA